MTKSRLLDAGRRIDKIGFAEIDQHRPTPLQERKSVAMAQSGCRNGAVMECNDYLGSGPELKNKDIPVGIQTDLPKRGAKIEMNG